MVRKIINWYLNVFGFIEKEKSSTQLEEGNDIDVAQANLQWFFNNRKFSEIEIEKIKLGRKFKSTFPSLTQLILLARVSRFKMDDKKFRIYSWTTKNNNSCGWICQLGKKGTSLKFIKEHQTLVRHLGGIMECWSEYDELEAVATYALTLNQNFLFVPVLCKKGLGKEEEPYLDLCQRSGVNPHPNIKELILFAKEANGNCTLYDPKNGAVFLYAHDHDFDYAEAIEDQPPMTFHKIKDCDNFVDYVEKISSDWLSMIIK